MLDRVKSKFSEEGFRSVLERRPSVQIYIKKVDGDLEAKFVTLCCSEPPEGFSKGSTFSLPINPFQRKNKNAKIYWQFTNEQARIKLKRLYPSISN